jgi:type IV pilus assembly protein PilE
MHKHISPAHAPSHRGFTLVELMVVVAIVAILAAVGYPSYTEHVKKGQRAKAQAALMEAAQFMQRYYAANNSYKQDLNGTELKGSDIGLNNVGDLGYTLNLDATGTGYTLSMTPSSAQMKGDKCGTYTLTQAGVKGLKDNASGTTLKDCWK